MKAAALSDPETEQRIRRFLLGELAEADPSWNAETVELVETELIDQYLRRELSPEERRRFESHYLQHPGHQREVEIAAAFHRSIRRLRLPKRRILGAMGAFIGIVLAVIGYWQTTTVTLYPGSVRDFENRGSSSSEIRRLWPRRIRVALVEPIPAGQALAVLKGPGRNLWTKEVYITPGTDYLSLFLPTWQIPAGSYTIEIQTLQGQQFRTSASYPITLY